MCQVIEEDGNVMRVIRYNQPKSHLSEKIRHSKALSGDYLFPAVTVPYI